MSTRWNPPVALSAIEDRIVARCKKAKLYVSFDSTAMSCSMMRSSRSSRGCIPSDDAAMNRCRLRCWRWQQFSKRTRDCRTKMRSMRR